MGRVGSRHTLETRLKMRATHLGVPKSAEHRAKIAQALRGRKRPPETVEKMRLGQRGHKMPPHQVELQRIRMTGRGNPSWGKSVTHGPRTHWQRYRGIALRSRWEVRLAVAFDHRGWTWQYEPRRFDLGSCTYLPDFYVPETESYWEVKGWFDPRSQQKIARFRAQHPDLPLIVVDERVLRMMETVAA